MPAFPSSRTFPFESRLDSIEAALEVILTEVRNLRAQISEADETTESQLEDHQPDTPSLQADVLRQGLERKGSRSRRVDRECPVCGRTVPMKLVTGELHGHYAPGTKEDCRGTGLQIAPVCNDPMLGNQLSPEGQRRSRLFRPRKRLRTRPPLGQFQSQQASACAQFSQDPRAAANVDRSFARHPDRVNGQGVVDYLLRLEWSTNMSADTSPVDCSSTPTLRRGRA